MFVLKLRTETIERSLSMVEFWELNANDLEDLETLYDLGMGTFKGVN